MGERPINIQDIQKEIKLIKSEIKILKQTYHNLEQKLTENNNTQNIDSNNFLMAISEITTKKWIIPIEISINNEFSINTTALFDTGADLNCIKEGLIPTKYYNKTIEKLRSA